MAWLLTIALPAGADVEDLQARLWELGTTGIAEVEVDATPAIIAGFEQRADAEVAAAAIGPIAVVSPVDASAWPTPEPQELIVGGLVLSIEVGQAFGHGHHATTRLALDAVTRLTSASTAVLDVGTGTGILALAAAALGAQPVVGVDIDLEAVTIARRNAVSNGLDVTITDDTLDELGSFDLVVVNMLASELEPIAPAVFGRLAPDATLVITGFLDEQRPWVESMFPSLSEHDYLQGDDRWGRLILSSRTSDG